MYTVYALVDPRDNKVHYVGITDDVYKRFIAHISGGAGSNYEKNTWVYEMREAGVMIRMDALERAENLGYARVRETYWINHYKLLKHPLTNIRQVAPTLTHKILVRSSDSRLSRKGAALMEDALVYDVESPMQSIVGAVPASSIEIPMSESEEYMYPLMDETQKAQFMALYPLHGIEKSLDQIRGCSHKHREHARVIIREHGLQRRRG